MPTIVTTSSAADFLAIVPHLVGFEPHNSIVFVAFRGRRTCGAMRFDLPEYLAPSPSQRPADDAVSKYYKRVATTIVGMLSKLPGVDAVVPVVYTSESFVQTKGLPRAAFVRAVVARFEFSGFLVRDSLCIASDGWGSYFDDRCPPAGRSLTQINDSRVLDDVPDHGARPLGDFAQWSALPTVALTERERVARRVHDFSTVIRRGILVSAQDSSADEHAANDDDFLNSGGVKGAPALREIPRALERILDRGNEKLDHNGAGFVTSLVRLPAIRDVVMLQWAFDLETGQRVMADARKYALGVPANELGSGGLMLGHGPRPDHERVDRAIELLKRVTALAPRDHQPPLFTMLAWLSWALGRSSVARIFVTAAEDIDPGYSFAELMHIVLERGVLPEWAFLSEA